MTACISIKTADTLSAETPEATQKGNLCFSEAKIFEDLLKDAKPGQETMGSSELYEKSGDIDDTKRDFYALNPFNLKKMNKIIIKVLPDGTKVETIEEGMRGILADGRVINYRAYSKETRPTLSDIETNE